VDGAFNTGALQFQWAQEPNIHKYVIKILTLFSQFEIDISASGWEQTHNISLTPGERYDIDVTSVAYGKECSTPFSIWESTYPAPPVEVPSSRTFDTTEISLEVSYTGEVQKVHIWLIPPEGSCVSGCEYPAPSTTHVTISSLTPGQEYQILLRTESNGKYSEWIQLTQSLPPAPIVYSQYVTGALQLSLEFQIESGVGSAIQVDYLGRYSGHSGSKIYEY
ncbi:uncharacterized protein LOC142355088, partial [Convolutriloba macropyga]|uniref:uncharacterized protein LOC142355088 n=1 Tax=Convolutriloba macropyga TaxID=536237 RepID=UPI003F527C88